MKFKNVGILIEDKDDVLRRELLASERDNEDRWEIHNNGYKSLIIPDVELKVLEEGRQLKYIYNINNTHNYNVMLLSLNDGQELTERASLNDLMSILMRQKAVKTIYNNSMKKCVEFELLNNKVTITETALISFNKNKNSMRIMIETV